MAFDPKQHLTNLRGKDYLETKWRIAWFKDEHPNGRIITRVLQSDPPLVRATVYTDDGFVLATGHGTAQAKAGAVWAGRELEKAETAAIGRALGHAGYGTQFTDEDELDNLADSPVSAQNGKQVSTPPQRAQNAPARPVDAPNASPPSTPSSQQPSGGSPDLLDQLFPPHVEGSVTVKLPPQIGTIDMKALGKRAFDEKLVHGQNHFANLIEKMVKEGWIRDAMNADQVLEAMRKREAEKDLAQEGAGK